MPVAAFDFHKVQVMKSLKRMPSVGEAQQLLEKVASQVQPIMRRRKLKVPLLSEFFPKNPNLHGLNCGGGGGNTREIKVRLRPHFDKSTLLPFHHILGTMLHELCHNHISPHNKEFFKMLDNLWEEVEELMDQGITGTGEGFDVQAAGKVGGKRHSEAELRSIMLKAAEKRAERNSLMPKGPRRLGSTADDQLRLLPPAKAAAAAAQRRLEEATACGCDELHGTHLGYDDERGEVIVLDDNDSGQQPQQAEPGSSRRHALDNSLANDGAAGGNVRNESGSGAAQQCVRSEVIDITLSDSDSDAAPAQHSSRPNGQTKRQYTGAKMGSSSWEWFCPACTFKNAPWSEACEVCCTQRTNDGTSHSPRPPVGFELFEW